MQCAQVLQYPAKAEKLGQALAARCKKAFGKIDAVASPAVGGLVMGQEVAVVYEGPLPLRRARRRHQPNDLPARVLREEGRAPPAGGRRADDRRLAAGADRRGAGTGRRGRRRGGVAERGDRDKGFADPQSLLRLDFQDYDPLDCPLCKQGIPAVKPGSRPDIPEI